MSTMEVMQKYAIGLVRVSSSKQGLVGDSHDKQKEEITKILVPKYNAPVTKWIELIQSGAGEIQPATQVIEYCKTHPEIKYCYVTVIDRFSRAGSYYYQHLKAQLAKYGVELVDAGGVISTDKINTLASLGKEYKWSKYSPSQKAEIMEAEDSRDEIRKILTRLIGSEIRYMRMGYWCANLPVGYMIENIETDNGKRCILKPDSQYSKYFLRMFELRVQGLTDQEIIKQINALGYRSKKRNIRDANNKIIGYKGNVKLTIKQLNKFITNPIYALVSAHKWLEKPALMQGAPIVTIEMFNKANKGKIYINKEGSDIQILKGKLIDKFTRKSKNNPDYAFKEYVLCPECRYKLKGSASRGKLGKLYPAYHCSVGHKYLRIPTGDMEDTIEEFVSKVKFTEEFKAKFRKTTIEELEKRIEQVGSDSIQSEKTVLQLKAEKQQIVDVLKSGRLTSPIAIKAVEEELEAVEFNLVQATQTTYVKDEEQLNLETLYNHCKYYVEHLEDLILGGTDPLQNAAFFGLIFDEAPTYEEIKHGTPSLAPLFKLNEAYRYSNSPIVDDEYLSWNSLLEHFNRIEATFQRFNYLAE